MIGENVYHFLLNRLRLIDVMTQNVNVTKTKIFKEPIEMLKETMIKLFNETGLSVIKNKFNVEKLFVDESIIKEINKIQFSKDEENVIIAYMNNTLFTAHYLMCIVWIEWDIYDASIRKIFLDNGIKLPDNSLIEYKDFKINKIENNVLEKIVAELPKNKNEISSYTGLPLENTWKLYMSSKTKSKEKYMQCNKVEHFENITTIDKVMEMIVYLGTNVNLDKRFKYLHEEEYFFMRENIEPLWEDEKNKDGGAYSIKVDFDKSYRVWANLIIYLVSGNYESIKSINGIQFSLKKNPNCIQNSNTMDNYCAFIKIWNNDKENKPDFPKEMLECIKDEFSGHIYTPFRTKEIFGKIPVVHGKYSKKPFKK